MAVTLLDGATSDGAGPEYVRAAPRPGDRRLTGTLFVTGTPDGATAGIELTPDGINWLRPADLTFTTPGATNIEIWCHAFRGYVSGSGTGTSLDVTLFTEQYG